LNKQVDAHEASGRNTTCSHQMLAEISWLSSSVMDFSRIEKRLDELEALQAHPEDESRAEQQDPIDGSWGKCHEEWFFKVNATYDHLTQPSRKGETPKYPLRLFDRVNSPGKLEEYFAAIATSDVQRTGLDHRKELNESLSNLTRLILRDQPATYHWDPKLKSTITALILGSLRNPQTGWWGERYVRNGGTEFVDDLSVTFHVVSYLGGKVPDLSRAMEHLLAVKGLDYPFGWLDEGRAANHHNMDVVTLFRYGWPEMSGPQRTAAAAEIAKMLDWCLRRSLQADGSFKPDVNSTDSSEESTAWGVAFLSRIGYFDPSLRFWTSASYPEAEQVRLRLLDYIQKHKDSGGAGGGYYESALQELRKAAPGK
jgi:hypothetical protein